MLYTAACCDFVTEALEGLTKCTASFTRYETGFKMDSFAFFCLHALFFPPFLASTSINDDEIANFRFVLTVF